MSEIPIFPLPLVLFPGGKLPLQIFEPRYLDMVKRCMREDSGFGIVMIVEGGQTLHHPEEQLPSISHCGTFCKVVDFDQTESGVLSIMVEGLKKFVIRDQYEQADRLMLATVEFLAPEDEAEVPTHQEHLSELVVSLMQHEAVQRLGLACDFTRASEVGARLTELLPCANQIKQRLLEMKDPLVRLHALDKLVDQLQNGDA